MDTLTKRFLIFTEAWVIVIACAILFSHCSSVDRVGTPRDYRQEQDTTAAVQKPEYRNIKFVLYALSSESYKEKTEIVRDNTSSGTVITMNQWINQINTKYKLLIDRLKLEDAAQDIADARERTENAAKVTAGTMTLREKDIRLEQMIAADKARAQAITDAENARLAELSLAWKSNTTEGTIVTIPEKFLEGDVLINGDVSLYAKFGVNDWSSPFVTMKVGSVASIKFRSSDEYKSYVVRIMTSSGQTIHQEQFIGGEANVSKEVK